MIQTFHFIFLFFLVHNTMCFKTHVQNNIIQKFYTPKNTNVIQAIQNTETEQPSKQDFFYY